MRFPSFTRLAAFLSIALIYVSPVTAETWSRILAEVRRRFPMVRQLSTADLAAWLADASRTTPRLVDVRGKAEYDVSHLQGARHATRVADVRALGIPESDPVVVYCSVGYRSSALAHRLQRAGYTNVFNLEGSIFAWANEGRPVFRGAEQVEVVHAYDPKWGQLLDRRWHAPADSRTE